MRGGRSKGQNHMKKKILSVFIVGTLALTSWVPVQAEPTQEVKENQQRYEEMNQKIASTESEVYKLNMEIDPLVDKIKTNNQLIKDIKEEVENTNKEIETSKVEIEDREEVLGKRLREVYKSGGQSSYLGLLFSAESFSDLISKIDATGRLVNIDKKIVSELVDKKDKLDEKVKSLNEKNEEIVKVNKETQKSLEVFEEKKAEQQVIIDKLNVERAEFDKEFLAVSERTIVQAQIAIIDSSNSISELKDAISQLRNIRDNQLKSPTVIEEVNSKIEAAKSKISSLEEQQAAENVPNRGDVPTVSGDAGALVSFAYTLLGKPYVFGATGPDTFDCSGFTSYVYRHAAGIEITRTTFSQVGQGKAVSRSELQPGDLVFPHAGHVGIYVGGGSYIHAPQTGDVVKVSPVTQFYAARRILN